MKLKIQQTNMNKKIDNKEELEKYLRYYLEYYQGINPTIKWLENEL